MSDVLEHMMFFVTNIIVSESKHWNGWADPRALLSKTSGHSNTLHNSSGVGTMRLFANNGIQANTRKYLAQIGRKVFV